MLEVSLEGQPDPVTGMVLDLKELKEILNREVVEPYDHRFLNYEVPPFDRVVPTTENIARDIWQPPGAASDRAAGAACTPCGCTKRPTCTWTISESSHVPRDAPLPVRGFPPPARAAIERGGNRRIYGKCNHPYGHGHNYVVEVSARGPLDELPAAPSIPRGWTIWWRAQVLAPFDHRNLNPRNRIVRAAGAHFGEPGGRDLPQIEGALARGVSRRMAASWNGSASPRPRATSLKLKPMKSNKAMVKVMRREEPRGRDHRAAGQRDPGQAGRRSRRAKAWRARPSAWNRRCSS